jgi:pantetheine-phosphate adenylyltransferase
LLKERFPSNTYAISKLDDDFGPAVVEGDVEALVVSDETAHQGQVLNRMRAERGLGPVGVVIVPMVLASDGKRISSTRIRNSEIDAEGNMR